MSLPFAVRMSVVTLSAPLKRICWAGWSLGNFRRTKSTRLAWPVAEAAEAYRRTMLILAGPARAYDVCFLGMGDDCHTASLFPGTPLLADDGGLSFGGQEVPGKGWRLTITPTGLRQCGLIVVMTLGAGKAEALHRVMRGPYDPNNVPSQILKSWADRVVWLVDEAAAARL